MALKPNYRLNIEVNYNRDRVDLIGGSFVTNLLGSRIKYSFNTRMFLNAFLQYNTDARQFSSNIRFRLIHHPLSDLFIVYNDRRDPQTGELLDRAIIFKFTNLFIFREVGNRCGSCAQIARITGMGVEDSLRRLRGLRGLGVQGARALIAA